MTTKERQEHNRVFPRTTQTDLDIEFTIFGVAKSRGWGVITLTSAAEGTKVKHKTQ